MLICRAMWIQIWQVIQTMGGAQRGMYLLLEVQQLAGYPNYNKQWLFLLQRQSMLPSQRVPKEFIWLQRFIEELGQKHGHGNLWSDSQSAIHLAKNSAFHSRKKHIQLRYHFIQSAMEDGLVRLCKIHTSQNFADMLTKVVPREKLSFCSTSVGLKE